MVKSIKISTYETCLHSLLLFLFSFSAFTQNIVGEWYGNLNAMGRKIPIGTNITMEGGVYYGELTNPEKKGAEIKMDTLSVVNDSIYFEVKKLRIKFIGTFSDKKIIGKFTQGM